MAATWAMSKILSEDGGVTWGLVHHAEHLHGDQLAFLGGDVEDERLVGP